MTSEIFPLMILNRKKMIGEELEMVYGVFSIEFLNFVQCIWCSNESIGPCDGDGEWNQKFVCFSCNGESERIGWNHKLHKNYIFLETC